MGEAGATIARKLLAAGILVVAAWFLLKVVLGIVTTLAWFLAVIVGIAAVVWAVRTL